MDDTHTKLDAGQGQTFTDNLNSLDPDIQFTTEGEEEEVLSFLDTNTVRKPDGSMKITKAMHTNQYPYSTSNHSLEHKLSVVRTLQHRVRMVIRREIGTLEWGMSTVPLDSVDTWIGQYREVWLLQRRRVPCRRERD